VPGQTVVLDRDDMRRTLVRIAHEVVEKNPPADPGAPTAGPSAAPAGVAIVGIHRRGAVLAERLRALIDELIEPPVPLGLLDISFYRDDFAIRAPGSGSPVVHSTQLDFPLEGRTIVIVDDVLYTGRTVRAAIDEVFDYGRPARVQLAVLIDRGHRELPIRPDYVGKNLPTAREQRVNVRLEEIDGYEEVAIGPAEKPQRRVA
jgi:pyrimidine operon attenuation protein/uracil phosphoribosyltransferase